MIYRNKNKSDKIDAEYLARLARVDPKLLKPIQHRGPEAQVALSALRARDSLVRTRTLLINHVRGAVKSFGGRVTGCTAFNFHRKALDCIPKELKGILAPLVETIGHLKEQIAFYDRVIDTQLCKKKYPETEILRQVPGVGPLTACAFLLTLEEPCRFRNSRVVGAYLGLAPRRAASAEQDPQLQITKAGDGFLRRLLVSSAHYILTRNAPDTDLKRYGEALAQRGGKNAKKRAVVAVACKLAVLLHRLWTTGEVYEPLRNSARRQRRQAFA